VEPDLLPCRFDPALFRQDLARADPVAIEIEAAQGWSPAFWPATGEELPCWQAVGGQEPPTGVLGLLEEDVLFGPGVQLPHALPVLGDQAAPAL
jgi:hypothetical protein